MITPKYETRYGDVSYQITVPMQKPLVDSLTELAAAAERSRASYIRWALSRWVEQQGGQQAKDASERMV